MPESGVLVIGDQVIGYSEHYVYACWDVNTDARTERSCAIESPFLLQSSSRYVYHEHVQYTFSGRYASILYDPIPVSDRYVYANYILNKTTERTCYFYPDTGYRYCFYESLLTQTPLLLKTPKYVDWEYIPQIINPEFKIWSHYDLNEDDISLHITSDNNANIFLNSGINKSVFKIEKESDKIYKITCYVDHVFDNGEEIDCHLTLFDVKGNHLKDGMW